MFSFFSSFICAIGFYPLLYKLNKPAARWRSIALLAVVVLWRPLCLLWQRFFMFAQVDSPTLIDVTVVHIALSLFVCVLLSNNRLRALIAASYTFCIVNLTHLPIGYFVFAVVYPLTDGQSWVETLQQYPQIYYSLILLSNMVIAGCCFFAARWLRETSKKPPLQLYVGFNLLFVVFPLGVLLLWEEIAAVMSVSFWAIAFIGTLFWGIMIFLFYLYTCLTKDNVPTGIKETENSLSEYSSFIPHLSRRELEVIEAVLTGNVSHKRLSAALNISVSTVKTHLRHIYQTTGVSSIAALSFLFRGFTPHQPQIIP